MKNDGDYYERCMAMNYVEENETRSWDSDPAFRRVLDLLNAGDSVKARSELEDLALRFPDFAYIYVWWAHSFLSEENHQEAKKVLHEGYEPKHLTGEKTRRSTKIRCFSSSSQVFPHWRKATWLRGRTWQVIFRHLVRIGRYSRRTCRGFRGGNLSR